MRVLKVARKPRQTALLLYFQGCKCAAFKYQDSHLTVDVQLQTVQLDGQLLKLTQKEFDLLALLVRRAGPQGT